MELTTEGSKIALSIVCGIQYHPVFWGFCYTLGTTGHEMHKITNAIDMLRDKRSVDKTYLSRLKRISDYSDISLPVLSFLDKESDNYSGNISDFMNYFESVDLIY